MDWLILVSVALGTYRFSHMVVAEDGPAYVFSKIRAWVQDATIESKLQWIHEGINCILCVSFWLSWLFSGLACLLIGETAVSWFFLGMGTSGLTLLISWANMAIWDR